MGKRRIRGTGTPSCHRTEGEGGQFDLRWDVRKLCGLVKKAWPEVDMETEQSLMERHAGKRGCRKYLRAAVTLLHLFFLLPSPRLVLHRRCCSPMAEVPHIFVHLLTSSVCMVHELTRVIALLVLSPPPLLPKQ